MASAKDSEADMTPATSEESVAVPEPSGRLLRSRHPPYNVMVKRAIGALRNKRGTSSKAIARYICAHFIVKKAPCRSAVARSLKRMVRGGYIYRNKRNLYKLTGKGRRLKAKKRKKTRRSGRKGARRRRRRRRRKSNKKGKKSKKAKKGRKRSRRSRKSRRGRKQKMKSKRTKRMNKKRTRRGKRAKKAGRKGKH